MLTRVLQNKWSFRGENSTLLRRTSDSRRALYYNTTNQFGNNVYLAEELDCMVHNVHYVVIAQHKLPVVYEIQTANVCV